LRRLGRHHPELVDNVRGRGLMCAFDLPTTQLRNQMIETLQRDERVLALACGPRSLRLRPALSISENEVALALTAFERVAKRLTDELPAT
jgi:L-lysine 6-transaminase